MEKFIQESRFMIVVNELRIGNWVYSNPALQHPNVAVKPLLVHVSAIGPGKVCAIPHNLEHRVEFFDDALLARKVPEFMPEDLEAIPLSPEWLKNFGFEKAGNSDWMSREKNGLQIKISDNLGFCFAGSGSIEIKTVHQLQNLYFAVTTQELELKDT